MRKKNRMTVNNAGSHSVVEINVTPLVDVVLVLLIIFMVVTPLMEKDIEVKVPETEQLETPEEMPPADQLVVGISEEGQLAINLEKVSADDYVSKLKRMVYAKPAGARLVFFMPHEKVNYGVLVAALDGARQAGAETLGMMTEIPEGGIPAAQPAQPSDPNAVAPTGTTGVP